MGIDLKSLGKRVKSARIAAGFTQAKLAEVAGVTDETISRLERGAFEPSLTTMIAVTRVVGLDFAGWLENDALLTTADGAPPEEALLLSRLLSAARLLSTEELLVLIRVADLLGARR